MTPEDWQRSRLGDLADIRFSNVDKKTHVDETPVLLCNYTDVYYNSRITNQISFMHATAKEREIDKFSLQQGDVIITKDSETPDDIAVPTYVSEKLENVLCGYHLTLLRPYKENTSGEYLGHLFNLPSIQHHFYVLANGITRFGLTSDAVTEAPIVHPPLPEQKKIATILTSVDESIEKQQAQISKLQDLKKAMMQELLTKGIGHTEFKDSLVGRIPVGWEVVNVSDIGKVKGGKRMPKGRSFSETRTKYPYIRVSDFSNGSISLRNIKYVLSEDREKIKRYIISKNDLYISIAGSIGIVGTIPDILDGSQLTENAARIIIQDSMDKQYLKYLLQSDLCQSQFLQEKGTGGGVPKLALFRVEKTTIPCPSLPEQHEIGRIISSAVASIEAKQKKLAQTKSLKKSLMQDLLTGKVRVKV